MQKPSFLIWLYNETSAAGRLLAGLLARRDHLLYVEASILRQEYMEKVGVFEEEVLESELDVSMMQREIELIQTEINRREPIDIKEIEKKVETERQQKLDELETNSNAVFQGKTGLNNEDMAEMRKKYDRIVKDFHPAVNQNMAEAEKELYDMALDAYRRHDLDSMILIDEILYSKPEPEIEVQVANDADLTNTEEIYDSIYDLYENLVSNYTLAAKLYEYFYESEPEKVFKNSLERYTAQIRELQREIDSIMTVFPFSAAATLNDPVKLDEYLADLKSRLRRSEEEKVEYNTRIEKMLDGRNKI